MSESIQLLIAGFGGQGILFAGKFLATLGLMEDKQVSWLPSYGPEMRGGTASCSVIVSDAAVGSPIVSQPQQLIAMNRPSLERYEPTVTAGGLVLYDSYLVQNAQPRGDVRVFAVPATKIALDEGLDGLANMVMMGTFLREARPESFERVDALLEELVPPQRQHLIELNRRALELGRNYKG